MMPDESSQEESPKLADLRSRFERLAGYVNDLGNIHAKHNNSITKLQDRVRELESSIENRGLIPEAAPARKEYLVDKAKYQRVWASRAMSHRLIAIATVNGVVFLPIELMWMHWIIAIVSLVVSVGVGFLANIIKPTGKQICDAEKEFIESEQDYYLALEKSNESDGK